MAAKWYIMVTLLGIMAKMVFEAKDGWTEKFKEKDVKKYYFISPDGEKCVVDCYVGVRNVYILTGKEADATRVSRSDFFKLFKKYNER